MIIEKEKCVIIKKCRIDIKYWWKNFRAQNWTIFKYQGLDSNFLFRCKTCLTSKIEVGSDDEEIGDNNNDTQDEYEARLHESLQRGLLHAAAPTRCIPLDRPSPISLSLSLALPAQSWASSVFPSKTPMTSQLLLASSSSKGSSPPRDAFFCWLFRESFDYHRRSIDCRCTDGSE